MHLSTKVLILVVVLALTTEVANAGPAPGPDPMPRKRGRGRGGKRGTLFNLISIINVEVRINVKGVQNLPNH